MFPLLHFCPELVAAVVDHLSLDSKHNLCLAGNHNLLALVRPYTWREITITLRSGGNSNETRKSVELAARLRSFCSVPAKARAVRSINITLVGAFDVTAPAIAALLDAFPLLINSTCASVICTDSTNTPGLPSHAHLIKMAVQRLPSLLSLRVDCCTDGSEAEYHDMAAYPVPRLQHVATRFCNHKGISHLWKYCSNLQVIEMEGGPAEQFWRENALDPSSQFPGHTSYDSGIDFVFAGRSPIFDTAAKVKLISESNYDDSDARSLAQSFEKSRYSSPSSSLKEWAMSLSMNVEQYGHILRGLRSPVLERLGITPTAETEDWDPCEFSDYLVKLNRDDKLFFAAFKSLSDLSLPCDGISSQVLNILPSFLSHAPALRHLYFTSASASPENQNLSEAAASYAQSIPTLQSVSWRETATFRFGIRNGAGAAITCVQAPFVAPIWESWDGLGASSSRL
ncbi:hypothetical protein R3P38DRAFT_2836736 [Favolaschia claudopus]|uniref:F-box protein n=1 Tax=Favolaschia claudopus TaxID=2862362 RepID=A0AAW0E6U9_9AGAR